MVDRGCTLTQGYWKTHSSYGPAPLRRQLGAAAERCGHAGFFGTGKTWYEVFWTPPQGGNAYLILAHQYEAALLNQLNGASVTPAVEVAMDSAEGLLTDNDIDPAPKGGTRKTMLSLASILAAYNEGYIGPGHCSEDGSSSNSE